jgi:hypothetical protein
MSGRAAAASSSHSAAQRTSEASRPKPHTMTTQGGHRQLQLPMANLARIQPLPVGLPTANHLPRRRPSPSRPSAGPARACASFERQAPTSGRRRAVMDMAGDHADPGHPSRAAGGPTATPRDLIPVGHSGRRNARTPEAGHWTPGRSDARTGHQSRGQAPVGHRTLAPDTGHRMPDTNADTVTTAQPACRPPCRHAERPHAETCNRVDAVAQPAGCSAAPPAKRRLGALLSSDDYGSSVERTAKLHPLWHLPCGSFQYERGCPAKRPQLGTW